MPSVNTVLSILDKPFLKPWAIKGSVNEAIRLMNNNTADTDRIFREAALWSENYRTYAANVGTEAHKIIENWIRSGRSNYQDGVNIANSIANAEVRQAFVAFLKWALDREPKYIASEIMGESRMGYAGTCDAICDIEGVRYLVDFKTSTRLNDTYAIQVAAYRHMFNEHGYAIDQSALLRLDKKTGKYQWQAISDAEDRVLFARFECLLKYWVLTFGDRRR